MARADTTAKSSPSTEDLQKQIGALKGDVAALTGALEEYGKAQSAHLKSVAENAARGVAQKGEETLHAAQDQAAKAYHNSEQHIRDNPAAAVGIAAGIGFVVGLFAGRR